MKISRFIMVTLALFLIHTNAFAEGFLNDLTDSVKESAGDTFKNNTTRDTTSIVDEASISKAQERKRQRAEEARVAKEQRQAEEESQREASRSVASASSSDGNPIGFNAGDLGKIDAYAENMGITREQAIRILTIQGLKK